MIDEQTILNFSKNPHGDIIIEFNPRNIKFSIVIKSILALLIKIFMPVFTIFDFLASKRKLVVSSVGLGIGLGLSVIVTQRPDTLQAFPAYSSTLAGNIRVQRIIVSSTDLSASVISGNLQDMFKNVTLNALVHDERSAGLGSTKPVVIAEVGVQNVLKDLELLQIGDKIEVIGSNNAHYLFKVTELRDMKAEYLPSVIAVHDESIILYKPKNVLRTQLYMVVAKP